MPRVKKGKPTQRDVILAFVRKRGICTTHDIRDAFGLELDRVGNILTRLRNDGLVERDKTPGCPVQWAATGNLVDEGDYPIVVRRAEWECNTPRNEFERFLFGAAA